METDIATLGIEFNTAPLVKGKAVLDETTAAGNRTADSLDSLGTRGSASLEKVGSAASILKSTLAGISFAVVVRELYDADVALNSIKSTLSVALGPQAASGMQFVRAEAQRLGLSLESTAHSFADFEAASIGSSLQGQKAATIFSSVAEAIAALHIPTQQSSSLFLALQQMMSKGTVQAQELHLQFGQAIPGAMGMAARAMGVTTAELNKMVASGTVLATDFLPKLAVELHNTFGGAAIAASDNLLANTNRLGTSFTNLKQAVNAAGVSAGLNEAAKSLGALVDVATANIGPILELGKAIAAVFIARSAAPFVVQVVAAAQALQLQTMSALGAQAAEVRYQAALMQSAQAAVAKARAVEVAAAAEVSNLRALVASTQAEIALEQVRLAAQISEQGRTATLARMVEASVAAAGATQLLAAAERNLAAAQAGVVGASAVAATASATAATAVTAAGLGARAAALGMGLFRGALTFLGGPVGIAITGLSLLYMWLNRSGDAAESAGPKIAKSLHDAAEEARRLKSGGPILGADELAQIADGQKQLEAFTGVVADLQRQRDEFLKKGDNATAAEFAKNIQNVQGEIRTLTTDIATLKGEQVGMLDPEKINEATTKLRENNAELLLAVQLIKQGTSAKNALGDAKLLMQGVSPADVTANNLYKKTLDDITKAEESATQAAKRHADEVRNANESSLRKIAAYTVENQLIAQGVPLEEARMRGELASKGVREETINLLVKQDALQRSLLQHAADAKTLETLASENDLIIKGTAALEAKARAAIIAEAAPRGPQAVKQALADFDQVTAATKYTEALAKVSDAANAAKIAQANYLLEVRAANDLQASGAINAAQYAQALYNAETARAQGAGGAAAQILEMQRINELLNEGYNLQDAQNEVALRAAGATKEQTDALTQLRDAQDALTGADIAAPFKSLEDALTQLSSTWGKASAQIVGGFHDIAQASIDGAALEKKISNQKGGATQQQLVDLQNLKAKTLAGYGSMAAGVQTYFKEGSAGYKAFGAVSKAFYTAEMLLNLETVAAKLLGIETVTTAKVAGDGVQTVSEFAHTAAAIAQSGARTAVKAVEALVSQLTLPFPANIPAFAATAAILAGLGLAVAGAAGGGGGGASSADQQAKQGTGTVLGDSSAKSESIAKGIEELGKLETGMLSYSQRMLAELTDINAGINGLGSLLIQANIATGGATPFGSNLGRTGIGGFLSGSVAGVLGKYGDFLSVGISKIFDQFGSLGAGLSKILTGPTALGGKLFGSIANAVFGGKQSLSDTGININGTVGDFDARYYAKIKTDGGMFGSDSTKTKYANLDAQTADQIGKVISGLGQAVADGIGALGGDTAKAKAILDQMNLDIGNISLKKLKGDEVQKALAAVFSALGDRMATAAGAVLSNIDLQKFQQVGEGVLQTLARVASNFEYAKQAAESLNIALVPLTNEFATSADVASDLIKASVAASETTNGIVSGLGQLAQGFNGGPEDLVAFIKSLYLVRTSLNEVRINGNALTATLLNAAGGIDNLQSALDKYQDAFFSDAEKAAAKTGSMATAFAKLGLALPDSYTQFRALVDSIDTSTDAGQKLLGNVLSLASGFDDLQQSLEQANQAQLELQKTLDQAVGSNDLPEKKLGDLMAQFDNAFALALSSSGTDLQKQAGVINDLIGPLIDEIRTVYASGEQSVELQDYVSAAVQSIIGKLASEGSNYVVPAYVAPTPAQVPQQVPPTTPAPAPAPAADADTKLTFLQMLQQLSASSTHLGALVGLDQTGFNKLAELLESMDSRLESMETSARLGILA